MKKLTFKTQFRMCMGVLLLGFVLAHITKHGILINIAWILYGLCFIINPVWPEVCDYADHEKLRLGCRIGGVLVIVVGLITRFGV